MDWQTQRQDILDVVQFTEKLIEFLVTLVPPPHRRQYRRVWDQQVKPKIRKVAEQIQLLNASNTTAWTQLDDVGWNPESARLKADMIAAEAEAGKLENTLSFVNSSLGSLAKVFPMLEPAKEFKEFLEPWVKGRSEPEPAIQTLFGPGPIPGPTT
jgi:hypothetical protein